MSTTSLPFFQVLRASFKNAILFTRSFIQTLRYQLQENLSFEKACQKSEALLDYIVKFPDKLRLDCYGKPLREHLTDIRWLRPRQEKPSFYPENLSWYVFICNMLERLFITNKRNFTAMNF